MAIEDLTGIKQDMAELKRANEIVEEAYQEILDIMQSTQTNQNTSNTTSPRISMKDELKNFLRGSNQGN